MADTVESSHRWVLLIHQTPPKPGYLRIKQRRRLQRLGAVPLKRTVYALPAGDQFREDFEWLARDVASQGGEATVCEASQLDVDSDRRLVEAFRSGCAAEYRAIAAASRAAGPADLERLTIRLRAASALDQFTAEGRADAEAALATLATRLSQPGSSMTTPQSSLTPGRVWVTRAAVYVDRIASAWLIRRFIDPQAGFRFVDPRGYQAGPEDLRFDMFEGEFTHDGDSCTFETLCRHFGLHDPALAFIGQIVHEIDCKDDKFHRAETPGVQLALDGIVRNHGADEDRVARGSALWDDLYAQLQQALR
jgi:hypothetical protein